MFFILFYFYKIRIRPTEYVSSIVFVINDMNDKINRINNECWNPTVDGSGSSSLEILKCLPAIFFQSSRVPNVNEVGY